MSVVTYRGNVSSAFFPFVSRYQGRTIIVPGPDNNFNRQLQSAADSDKDIGIPQVYYCHNVMPNGDGLQSIGYEQRISAIDGTNRLIFQQITLRDDAAGKKGSFAFALNGFYYTVNEAVGWSVLINSYFDPASGLVVPFPAGIFTDRPLSFAHVGGITYLYVSGFGCFVWDFTLNRFVITALTALVASEIIGLTESNGYLIAFSSNAVAWSSLIDPTDFTPSLQTGAGGGNVEGVKGNITCGAPTSNGFVLYTEANAVAVLYTGNAQYPFQFSECVGAGGVSTIERVTYDADSGFNYAYTSYGFQILRAKTAETVLADVTDFLAGQQLEDFDDTSLAFSYYTLTAPLLKKLTYVANRYLIISYGITELTHAIVYDTVQKRFGKLKFTHVDCFQYELLSEAVSDIPRKSIAFIKNTGAVHVVNFALPFTARNGTVLLGKYQYVRARNLQLQLAEIEGPTDGGVMSVYDFVSVDGKNYSYILPATPITIAPDLGIYGFGSPDAKNHSILIQGAYNLSTIILSFNISGSAIS